MRLSPLKWPAVSEAVQCILNQSPLRRLGNIDATVSGIFRNPLEGFTGHKPVRPIIRALPIHVYKNVENIEATRAEQLINIHQVQEKLENVHCLVGANIRKSRLSARKLQNSKTNVKTVNFTVGDFVLIIPAINK